MYRALYSDQTAIAMRCELIAIKHEKLWMVIARGFLEKPPHTQGVRVGAHIAKPLMESMFVSGVSHFEIV